MYRGAASLLPSYHLLKTCPTKWHRRCVDFGHLTGRQRPQASGGGHPESVLQEAPVAAIRQGRECHPQTSPEDPCGAR